MIRPFLTGILTLVTAFSTLAQDQALEFTRSTISDEQGGLKATLFTFTPEQNRGFGIHDVPTKQPGDNVSKHFDPSRHDLMINGGYFDGYFTPDGYCKIDGKEIVPTVNPRWSGFVAIGVDGDVALLGRGADLTKYPTVLQSGPYVIDPGGKVGIRSKKGMNARRTLIGMTTNQQLIILITEPIYLFDLANVVKHSLPNLERLLNLDGGPSTGVMANGVADVNPVPVRNYLFRRRTQ